MVVYKVDKSHVLMRCFQSYRRGGGWLISYIVTISMYLCMYSIQVGNLIYYTRIVLFQSGGFGNVLYKYKLKG